MLFDCYNLLQVAKILNNYNKCHVWAQAEKRISGLSLVAHNRPLDENCLKAAYEKHGMDTGIFSTTPDLILSLIP